METDLPASGNHLFQYLKYPFHLKQFFRHLEIYLKRILYLLQLVATDFLFIGNGILSFRFLWKLLLQLEGSHHF